MIDAPASKSFTVRRRFPQKIRISPLVWMNAVCLDAPLVAVSWLWLFARGFEVPVASAGIAALFLTAWLIYLADRLGDSAFADPRHSTSFRQRFCLNHRRAWLGLIAAVAASDVVVIVTQLGSGVLVVGAAVALLAVAYLLTNRFRPVVWRFVPVKEVAVGVLFAAGTMVPLAVHLPSAAVLPWLFFAALCTLNCISIAAWERWLDRAQQRISIATAFPRIGGFVLPALLLCSLTSFAAALTNRAPQPVYVCVGTSAWLLAVTHLCRRRIQPDVRTAIADLVLLTPAALLVFEQF